MWKNHHLSSKFKISSVESFTGGLFATEMIKNPGASNWFAGSLVLYQNKAKNKFLIDTKKGVINKETALNMTKIGNENFETDFCISFTGNAGPTYNEGKKGEIYIACNDVVFQLFLKGSRKKIQKKAVNFIKQYLLKEKIIFYT
ncbi:MAG: CinA family protein [Metamycoplasmataceae bacterium]